MKKIKEGLSEARQSPMSIETMIHWFSQNIEITPQEVDRETFERAIEIVQETENGKICLLPPNPSWQDLKKITTSLRASELDDASREKYEKIHETEYDFLRKVSKYLSELKIDNLSETEQNLYQEIKDFFAEIGDFSQNKEEVILNEEDKEEIEIFLLGRDIYEKQKVRFETREATGKTTETWEKMIKRRAKQVLNILNKDFRDIPVVSKGKIIQSQFIDGLQASVKPKTEFVQTPHDIGMEQLLEDTEELVAYEGGSTIRKIIERDMPTENKIKMIVGILRLNFNSTDKYEYGAPLLTRKNKETQCVGFTTLGKHLEKLSIDYCPFKMKGHSVAFALDGEQGYFIDISPNLVIPLTAEDFSQEITGIDWDTWKDFVQGKRTDWKEFALPAKITENSAYAKNNKFQSETGKKASFFDKNKGLFNKVLFNIGHPADNDIPDKMKAEYNKQALVGKCKEAYLNYGNLLVWATDLAVKNEQKAAEIYEKAIEVGYKKAYLNCAVLLQEATDSTVRNAPKAVEYYKKFVEVFEDDKEVAEYVQYAQKQIKLLSEK